MKKGEASVAVVVLIAIIILGFFTLLLMEGTKECRRDSDCSEAQYCGSDFSCHTNVVVNKSPLNLFWPSVILSVGLVTSALILRVNFNKRDSRMYEEWYEKYIEWMRKER